MHRNLFPGVSPWKTLASNPKSVAPRSRARGHFPYLKGGGGGGHSLRFLTVALAGLTALLAIPFPVSAQTLPCGDPENNAVLCDSNEGYDSGIKYDGQTNGLTLTVRPSVSTTITSTIPAGPLTTVFTGDVLLKGGGTLKVVLDGDVSVVNGAPRTLVDHTVDGPPSRTIQVIGTAHVNAYRTDGVYVEHNEDKDGEIVIDIGEEARIGAPDQPAGLYGIEVYWSKGNGDTTIVNRGKLYGHFKGIQAFYSKGTGDITIETTKGSVTSMGIRAHGSGDVTIRNHGRIERKQVPRYKKPDGTLDSETRYLDSLIKVEHVTSATSESGAEENPSHTLTVVSSGELEVDTKNWERYSEKSPPDPVNGIFVHSNKGGGAPDDTNVPITVHLMGGTIKVTGHGIHAEQRRAGNIKVTVEEGARVGTEETAVGRDGVWSRAAGSDRDKDAEIRITNRGLIHAKGSGVYAWHNGQGDVVVKHEMGKIIAGDKVGEFGRVSDADPISELSDKTAGILVVHGSSESIKDEDDTVKTFETGEIDITSSADIKSGGEGIFAYVKDLDSSESAGSPIVPITVNVMGGMITAKGAGVHAEIATDYTIVGNQAGSIAVKVDGAAKVMAEKDGVYVKGGGTQTVTINGKVMGGGGEHAGVRMRGGGTLMIGARAEIGAESGMAVKSDGKLTITMKKDSKGRITWIKDKIVNTADMTTFEGASEGETVTATSGVRMRGVYEGGMERRVTLKKTTADSLDTYQFKQESMREFREYHDRARVYEALPSVLLDLNRQTSPHARLSARRDGNGGWARVWFGDGEREADRSTTEGGEKGVALAWDFEHWGAEMGFDVPTSTEGLMLGVSAHYRDGEADVERGGRIDASGFGFGVSATYRAEEGLYVDGQVSYTRFDDIDLGSDARGRLASGLDADGYAVGLEVGRRMEMAERNVVLTPRGGLAWSSVDVDGFDDVKVEGYAGDRRVSFGSEDSFQGRVGVLAESVDGRMYASLDVEHEFSEDRDVTASGARLDSEAEATWARLGLGFRAELDETGEAVLSGQGFYALADGDNRDYGASVALRARF